MVKTVGSIFEERESVDKLSCCFMLFVLLLVLESLSHLRRNFVISEKT